MFRNQCRSLGRHCAQQSFAELPSTLPNANPRRLVGSRTESLLLQSGEVIGRQRDEPCTVRPGKACGLRGMA